MIIPKSISNCEVVLAVSLDSSGQLLIGDGGNGVVRRVSGGMVSTVTGDSVSVVDIHTTGGIQQGTGMVIHLLDSHGTQHTIEWNGNNNNGVPVDSGIYTVTLLSVDEASGNRSSKSLVTQLLRNDTFPHKVAVVSAPDPATDQMQVFYSVYSGTADITIKDAQKPLPPGGHGIASLYNLAGELVLVRHDRLGTGRVVFSVGSLASGIYFVVVEYWQDGAFISRTTSKAAILH